MGENQSAWARLPTVACSRQASFGNGGFTAAFSKSAPSAGSIKILSGAQINARNSYLALVAPRIEQGGNLQVNGSAAYVAAEGATMTLNGATVSAHAPLRKAEV